MKKIGELIRENQLSTSSGHPADKEQTSASTTLNQSNKKENLSSKLTGAHDFRMDILFTRLGAIYGQLWWNNYRSESLLTLAKQEWAEGLQRFDNQILKEVLLIYRAHKNYPPSLPQFVECCRAVTNRRVAKPSQPDSKKTPNRKIAEIYIKAILKKLKN